MARDGVPGLAVNLNRLFETIPRPEGGGLYTNEVAAKALGDLGVQVSAQHLWLLRTGKRDNPSFRLLDGIARLFGVPLAYFSDPDVEARVSAELSTLAALHDSGVKALLTRAHGVSPQNMAHLGAILDQIRQMEGLDAPQDPAGNPEE